MSSRRSLVKSHISFNEMKWSYEDDEGKCLQFFNIKNKFSWDIIYFISEKHLSYFLFRTLLGQVLDAVITIEL